MEYITVKEAAQKWNISVRSVQGYCKNKKIPGATCIGKQWLIPIDAPKPSDGRTKTAKKSFDFDTYHFPGFIYTDFFANHSMLNEDELSLLDAQILTIKGQHVKSFEICNKLISNSCISSVRFGAYCTNAYNSILLGLLSEINNCLLGMERIRDNSPSHAEDYNLLIAFIRFQLSFNAADFQKIDISKLSSEALNVYEIIQIDIAIFEKSSTTFHSLTNYAIVCQRLENHGILPALLVAHGAYSFLCYAIGDEEGKMYHIRKACHLGYDKKYISILSKVSSLNSSDFLSCFYEFGDDFANTIEDYHKNALKNWNAIYSSMNGSSLLQGLEAFEAEVVLLLSNGLTNTSIAKVKNIPLKKVDSTISKICNQLGLKTKAELVQYANAFFLPNE